MSRIYTVQFNAVAIVAAQDLFEIVAGTNRPCQVLAVYISQTLDVGDTEEEILSILFKTGQTTSGSGGTAPTPIPSNVNDSASQFTAEVNNTTIASTGTIVTHMADGWNVRMPYQLILPDDMQFDITGGERFTCELVSVPNDSLTVSGTIFVKEHG